MGKGSRKQNDKLAKREQKVERERAAKREQLRRTRRGMFAAITSIVVVIAIVALVIVDSKLKDKGTYLRNQTAMSTEHFEVNNAMFSFIINFYYESFKENNASQLESSGLDTTKSLKDQTYSGTQTWFDYFVSSISEEFHTSLRLCEAAYDANVSLTDAEKATLRRSADALDISKCGRGVTADDVYDVYLIQNLALKYEKYIYEKAAIDDAKLEAKFDELSDKYLVVNFIAQPLYYDEDSSGTLMTRDEAEDYSERLMEVKDADEYKSILSEYFTSQYGYEGDELQAKLDGAELSYDFASCNAEFLTWVQESDREAGDVWLYDNTEDSAITVFYLVELPHKNTDSAGINVRHILVTDDTEYAGASGAENVANAIYEDWKTKGTEEYFDELASVYTEDAGSKTTGGLYENVKKGAMIDEFDNWCYDDARVAGDSGIVKTNYGWHIMYFCGDSEETWKADMRALLEEDVYSTEIAALEESTVVNEYLSTMKKIDI